MVWWWNFLNGLKNVYFKNRLKYTNCGICMEKRRYKACFPYFSEYAWKFELLSLTIRLIKNALPNQVWWVWTMSCVEAMLTTKLLLFDLMGKVVPPQPLEGMWSGMWFGWGNKMWSWWRHHSKPLLNLKVKKIQSDLAESGHLNTRRKLWQIRWLKKLCFLLFFMLKIFLT